MHATLFAESMTALDSTTAMARTSTCSPGTTLATVNLMTLFGLHRRLRGAIVGHLAMFEMTSPNPNRRYANGLRRLGYDANATEFFDEHVEADAVHEAIAAHDLAQGLAIAEPNLTGDIIFGAKALLHTEAQFATQLLTMWNSDNTSLRHELRDYTPLLPRA